MGFNSGFKGLISFGADYCFVHLDISFKSSNSKSIHPHWIPDSRLSWHTTDGVCTYYECYVHTNGREPGTLPFRG